MNHKKLALAFALTMLAAGAAQAASPTQTERSSSAATDLLKGVATAQLSHSPTALSSLVVNVAGIQSFTDFGSASNTVLTFNVGAFATITSFDYNVVLTAFDPSWLSEMQVIATDSAVTDGVIFSPGIGFDDPGTSAYSASINLVDEALSFQVGADGLLRLEFAERFDDDGVAPDGRWDSGTLTVGIAAAVPEPSTYGMMALGLLAVGAFARRRKAG